MHTVCISTYRRVPCQLPVGSSANKKLMSIVSTRNLHCRDALTKPRVTKRLQDTLPLVYVVAGISGVTYAKGRFKRSLQKMCTMLWSLQNARPPSTPFWLLVGTGGMDLYGSLI